MAKPPAPKVLSLADRISRMNNRQKSWLMVLGMTAFAVLSIVVLLAWLNVPPPMTLDQYRRLATYLELPPDIEPKQAWTWYTFDSPGYSLWVRLDFEPAKTRAFIDRINTIPGITGYPLESMAGELSLALPPTLPARSLENWNILPLTKRDSALVKRYGINHSISSKMVLLVGDEKTRGSVYVLREGRLGELPPPVDRFLSVHRMNKWGLMPDDGVFCLKGINRSR